MRCHDYQLKIFNHISHTQLLCITGKMIGHKSVPYNYDKN